jgi:hypothetical protein
VRDGLSFPGSDSPLSKEAAMPESTTHAEVARPAAPLFDEARLAVGASSWPATAPRPGSPTPAT